MSDLGSTNWSETDNANSAVPPNGWPEGMVPSDVNNSARANMGAIKRWYNQTIPLLTGGTATAYTLTYAVPRAALTDGMTHLVRFHATNGAAASLNVDGLGAWPLWAYIAGTWMVAPAGAFPTDYIAEVAYDAGASIYRILGMHTCLGVQSTSGVGFVDLKSWPATANNVLVEFSVIPDTATAALHLNFFDPSGTIDNSPFYSYGTLAINQTGATPSPVGANGVTFIAMTGPMAAAAYGCAGDIQFSNLQNTSTIPRPNFRNNYIDSGGALGIGITGFGFRSLPVGARISGVRLSLNGGNGTWQASVHGRI